MTRRRTAAVLALALFPWTVTLYPGGSGFVFPWGLYSPDPGGVVLVTDYFLVHTNAAALPPHLTAWGVGTAVYALALTSAALGTAAGREDRRVTAALLVVAAVAHLRFSLGTDHAGVTTLPVGPVALFVVAWWFHAGDLRRIAVPG
ncbi:TIGR04206 family protein [Halostella litorea]|uniref:TIGR04206 family protein n=1 Tax=Halostella litorea TaxID=2528831 RepID=UPI001092BCFA|nr:TIGR04206 family protein [Halostella litorea]